MTYVLITLAVLLGFGYLLMDPPTRYSPAEVRRKQKANDSLDFEDEHNQSLIQVIMNNAHACDPEAMVEIARRFLNGEDVAQDHKQADYWFKRAAKFGHPVGKLYMAYKYQANGEYNLALEYFTQAANDGNTEAMEMVGNYYYYGNVVKTDHKKAFEYYKQAAEIGKRAASKRLYAQCLLMGEGTEQDIENGMIEMHASAKMGDKVARNIIHMGFAVYLQGKGLSLEVEDLSEHFSGKFKMDEPTKAYKGPAVDEMEEEDKRRFTPPDEHNIAPQDSELARHYKEPSLPEDEDDPLTPVQPTDVSLSQALDQLDSLIGLKDVKNSIHGYINRMQLYQLRKENGLPCPPMSAHLVFTGNPGTGKTTVARILGNIFREIGFLDKGHVVEVSRADLVGQYVGQTAPLVKKRVKQAMEGILFIDEAYSLLDKKDGGPNGGFGDEAVATLLKLMEDNRSNFVVIAAGYKDEMDDFVKSNPGLKSRFSRSIEFNDFSLYELEQIFEHMIKQYGFRMSKEATIALEAVLQDSIDFKNEHFGNARFIRNLFDEAQAHLANRIVDIKDPSKADLNIIQAEDIQKAGQTVMT